MKGGKSLGRGTSLPAAVTQREKPAGTTIRWQMNGESKQNTMSSTANTAFASP